MTSRQIIDTLLPYTPEENRCGFKKLAKTKKRVELIQLIDDYKAGLPVELPNNVKCMLQ